MEDKKICRKSCTSTFRFNKIQLKIIMAIKKYQGEELVSQTFLSEQLGVGLSTINYNIKKLIKKGVIE